MAGERLFPDSEGAWICKRHKVERASERHGSNCYRCLTEKFEQLQAENERQSKALEQLQQWAKAYPLSAFPEPDFVKVRKALKEHGISLDAVSASNMRHVITRVIDIVDQVLRKGGE